MSLQPKGSGSLTSNHHQHLPHRLKTSGTEEVKSPTYAARITNSLAVTTGRTVRNFRCISTSP